MSLCNDSTTSLSDCEASFEDDCMCDGDWAKSEDESSIYSDEYDSIHTFTSAQTWVEKRLKMTAET